MRSILNAAAPLAATLFLLGFSAPSAPSAPPAPDEVLLRVAEDLSGRALRDSKWGFIGALQQAINASAERCGITPVAHDGSFGIETALAAREVALCRGAAIDAGALHLTKRAFETVTGAPAPSAFQRALTLARTMEDTDYDDLEWNVCAAWTGDASSVLTWGPSGKTLGWGGELLDVLRSVDRALIEAAFEAEGAEGLDALLALRPGALSAANRHRYPGARALVQSICARPGQQAAWTRAFARLGASPEVRAAYDRGLWGDEAWFRTVVDRLSESWREAGLEPTEVDFAFFLDRSIHMGWGAPRFAAVDRALREARAAAPAGAWSNARARFAVADAVRPTARPEDRLARDAIFLVDSEAELAPLMAASRTWPRAWKTAWRLRADVAAADAGLSDLRPAPPWEGEAAKAAPLIGGLMPARAG